MSFVAEKVNSGQIFFCQCKLQKTIISVELKYAVLILKPVLTLKFDLQTLLK